MMHTADEVVRLTGVSYRRLDYWCRCGIIRPTKAAKGSGYFRGFTDADVAYLRAFLALVDAGLSLRSAREALEVADGIDRLIVRIARAGALRDLQEGAA